MEKETLALTQTLIDALRGLRTLRWQQHLSFGDCINPSEFFVLHKIAHREKHGDKDSAISPSEISQDLRLSSPTVTQHITSLESKGFITREMDPNDRRKIRILLTVKGKERMLKAKQSMLESFAGLIDHLGMNRTQQFIDLLNESSAYFSKLKMLEPHTGCDENKNIK